VLLLPLGSLLLDWVARLEPDPPLECCVEDVRGGTAVGIALCLRFEEGVFWSGDAADRFWWTGMGAGDARAARELIGELLSAALGLREGRRDEDVVDDDAAAAVYCWWASRVGDEWADG